MDEQTDKLHNKVMSPTLSMLLSRNITYEKNEKNTLIALGEDQNMVSEIVDKGCYTYSLNILVYHPFKYY